jgi:hypothetical protein
LVNYFLDQALEEANCGPKCRAIFREIYGKASARVKARSPSGETLLSDAFDVRRGVVQGDIFSPLCFILALAIIMKKHLPAGGISALGVLLDSLEYADDAALLDATPGCASDRVTALATGAWQDACMKIAVDKSKALFPREREKFAAPTREEYEAAEFGFTCAYCDRGFPTRDGLRSHLDLGWCGFQQRAENRSAEEYGVEKILEARGDQAHRWFKVRWSGDWGAEQESWLHSKDLEECAELVDEFWGSSGLDKSVRLEAPGENRCGQCCKFFKRPQDLKAYWTRKKLKGGCHAAQGGIQSWLAGREGPQEEAAAGSTG